MSPGAFLRDRTGRPNSTEFPRLSTPPLPRRRSSVLSFASDTRQSVQSAGDYILPGLGIDHNRTAEDESSHWHSSPLAFALLPALGGLIFTNGSAFITDVLLLGLAAIFLNWSCRLPWQWYHSAQGIRQASLRRPSSSSDRPTSPLERKSDPIGRKSSDSAIHSDDADTQKDADGPFDAESPEDAAEILRTHEKLAFISTFVLPALGAYLLHVIRGQLSNSSTVLVSDYNLTIFLLAAEIRPFRQLIKLITNRTLHLQRLANNLDHLAIEPQKTADFESRLELLEAKANEPAPNPLPTGVQKEEMSQLSVELRKRYEPRIEALERAVRRYEKRVTVLSIATENRLQALEARMQDALSLAAVAAQSSQRPSILTATVTYFARIVVMPVELACAACLWPIRVVEDLARVVLGGNKKGRKRATGKPPYKSKEKRPIKEEGSGGSAKGL
ncbi:hypothetical protein K461DRAFT_290058 [Myriangium duriaei CBS 260.36]|uniref:Uncharacterized protein n=1 Tax=Myriangium duriaei CBS 260.36 TaxID=1168546 RepID=A0A9P4J9G1_9PEZI|nr:hypothetical protein K461DRAFT_290058 [Myriangium duriaei CBS 260.36]